MPTNEAGLSEGHDMGDGGRIDASDMPGGEKNDGATKPEAGGIGHDAQSSGQVSTEDDAGA
jgi:hypothetical protein